MVSFKLDSASQQEKCRVEGNKIPLSFLAVSDGQRLLTVVYKTHGTPHTWFCLGYKNTEIVGCGSSYYSLGHGRIWTETRDTPPPRVAP